MRPNVGISCYSSKDLYHWKNEGIALKVSQDPASEIVAGSIIERPKVLYNKKTKTYVMWFHLELKGQGYSAARAGVAVSKQVTGPLYFSTQFSTGWRDVPRYDTFCRRRWQGIFDYHFRE
jgi:hypothetical protein